MSYNESKAAEINAHRVNSAVTDVAAPAFDIEANRFVKFLAADEIGYAAAATDAIIGVSDKAGNIGDIIPVFYSGIHKVVAGAAVAAGVFVTSDATGKAVTGTQANQRGKSIDAATAAGQLISVSLE
ncbi:MAG TPA: DUF2190 family protein [Flavobacterium alvei]|nr:DUF2190 family protein [Flavobacterium alvei]